MPVARRAVIRYIYKVGRCHPELERASDRALSDLIGAFSWEGLYLRKFGFPLACFLIVRGNRIIKSTPMMFLAMQGGCLRIHLAL